MLRNTVLLVSTLALLGVLFVGYQMLVEDPDVNPRAPRETDSALPVSQPSADGVPLRVGGRVEVPPGEGLEFTIFDERTGRPTQHFRCAAWSPVSGTKNEIFVTRPRFELRLPSGMVATILAADGQITLDRVEQAQGRPRLGWLRGDVEILIDRATHPDRTPLEERPQDLIAIAMVHLQFNLELGEMHTDGPIRITGEDFDISGAGFDLVWNQADNLVESLVLHEGRELVLYGGAGLVRATPGAASQPAAAPPAAAPTGSAKTAASGRKKPGRGATAYVCVLSGNVAADQLAGEEQLGSLAADELRLAFDVGGAADRLLRESPGPGPTTRPETGSRERLVLHWSGPLRLAPAASDTRSDRPRRHFEARGAPVTLAHADGVVRCARLEYYDETQQAWLYPTTNGRVDFALGAALSASADSAYIDRARNLIKLIGNVTLVSRRGPASEAPPQSLQCFLWAELRLSPAPVAANRADQSQKPAGGLLDYGQIDSATFVGDAQVDLGGQTLSAHRIDLAFKPVEGERTVEASLDTAVATGGVRLTRGRESLECERLELTFAETADRKLYPRRMDATGSVLIARDPSWIRGDRVQADLAPTPPEAGPNGPEFVLRSLEISGDAELRDPRNKVAARGQQISAAFTGLNRLSRATVRGPAQRHGVVYAAPYTVGAEQIELEWETQTLHVDGRSRLSFKAQRSLEGQRRERPVPVTVTSSESLHIDGVRNTVHFAGNVVAESGEEQLKADKLTLLLEDVEQPATTTQEQRPGYGELLQKARELWAQKRETEPQRDVLTLQPEELARTRKEPLRLVAENALVQSETYVSGDPQPLVHSSIAAPLLEVDIARREITTRGRTTLLLTNRRLEAGAAGEPEALGIPSALITRGPSQTAMQCETSLTYVLGEEGPSRRDSVLFQDGVVFVHRAGREMSNLEQMLPQLQTNPELLNTLQSRNTSLQCDRLECWFEVESGGRAGEPAPAAGRPVMQLTSLLASGRTHLRDDQGDLIREVYAHQIDFDRAAGVVRVLATPPGQVRIYEENREKQISQPIVADELVIDLRTNTVRAGATKGEFRQP